MKNQSFHQILGPYIEKVRQLDPKVLPFLWGGALALFLAVDLLLVMAPQCSGVASLWRGVAQLHQDITTLGANKTALAQLARQRDVLLNQIADFNRMVYPKDDLPRALQKISSVATREGVQIDQIVPQKMEPKPLCQSAEGKYYAVPVLIQARSGFKKFEKFLGRLERERVFWQADGFSFVADAQYPQRNQVKFWVKVIVLDK